MLTREEILSSFKKVDFPEKLIESNADVKNILFHSESKEPLSKKEKDTQTLNKSYVLPWRLVQRSFSEQNSMNFNRGSNFIPKEEIIELKLENLKLLYEKYNIPETIGLFYFKNNYGGMNGPFNLSQIQNSYKIKKLDSTFEFRPIDIFGFKESEIFSFKSIKIINENNWIDLIIDSPLLKYNKTSNTNDEQTKEIKEEKEGKKLIKNSDNKKAELKEEIKTEKVVEKKEEKKEEIKEKKEEKKEVATNKNNEEKWELIQKKKSKSGKEKEEEENNEIIGLKPKNTKEGKKGKKKKKQFEEVDVEFGFKIK
jgi:hypothetical protein